MPKSLIPIRPHRIRLLASVLLVASLLGNGLAVAQAPATAAKQDCCAEMMGSKTSAGGCDHSGNPCPAPGSGCDDQCLARCQSSVIVLPMFVLALPVGDLASIVLPRHSARGMTLADLGPGLRPPIFV